MLAIALFSVLASPVFPFPTAEHTLPNGLRLYAIEVDSPGLVAYYSVVRVGSRHEVEPGKTGFAHFFEHMMFHGTDAYPAATYNSVLKRMGASSNAWTWDDQTVYHILAGKDDLPKIVEIEADRFQRLTYDAAEFQKEARAVLGEYNKNAANPARKIEEAMRDAAYSHHTYKHTTMGLLADIESMPEQLDYSRAFFNRYYRPENVVIIAAGDVDPTGFFALAERHYGAWQPGAETPKIPAEPPPSGEQRMALAWPSATQPRLTLGYHAPAFSTRSIDHAALDVLAEAAFSSRSPLYRRLVVQEQKLESLMASNPDKVDPMLFTVSAVLTEPGAMAEVETAIQAEIDRIAREGLSPGTLQDIASHIRYAFAASLDTAQSVASTAAWYASLTGRVQAVNEYYALLARVTSEDVQRVAAQYLQPQRRTVVTLTAQQEAQP